MKIGYKTDVGRVRENNEDTLFIDKNISLFVVADGVGGHQGGEIASKITTKTIGHYINMGLNNCDREIKITDLVKKSIQKASEKIVKKSSQFNHLQGMSSTVALALKYKKRVFIANVGDSRVYLIRDGEIRQLSHDHSLVGELLKKRQNY